MNKEQKLSPNGMFVSPIPRNEIWYTSTDGRIMIPDIENVFNRNPFGDAQVISNTYKNGKGVIVFDKHVTSIVTPIGGISIFGGLDYHSAASLSRLVSMTIPDSVVKIGVGAFQGCSSLENINIPDSVMSIGMYAFNGCSNLKSVTLSNSVTSIGKGAFQSCSSLISVTIPDSVTCIEDATFWGCSSLASIVIPQNVTSIGERALSGCSSLTSITIPESVTCIEDATFWECSSLEIIVIPPSVTSIRSSAFSGCSSLTGITIPDRVARIGGCAFLCCSSLKGITLPSSITAIGEYAFCGCSRLASVYCKATTPPSGGSNMFDDNALARKIYVPRQSVEAYKSAKGWSDYADAIVGYDFEAEKKSVAVEQTDKLPYYLFFDTETTGLPRDFKSPASETYNWPRMVQLAWIVANKQGDILKKKSYIIRPEGYTISSSATAVHGITTEKALREGESMKKVLAEFGEDLAAAKVLVAHNMAFDNKIVHAEYIRLGCEDVWTNGPTKRLCTMMSSVNYCALPGFYDDYKWPKLQELHEKLFGYEFDDAHDALADIEATFKCYWELRKLGLIE